MRQFFVLIVLGFGLSFSACNLVNNPCADNICGNNATCDNGNCTCNFGYAKDANGACTVNWYDNFVGSWSVSDSCTANNYASVANFESQHGIRFQNFADVFDNVYAELTSDTTFKISSNQYYNTSSGRSVYLESLGECSMNAARTEFTLTYRVTDLQTNVITNCTSVWTK